MTTSELSTYIALVLSIVTIIGFVWGFGYKFGRIELQVHELWDFLMRRAKGEALSKGWGSTGSQFHINPTGYAKIEAFLDKFLPAFASMTKRKLSDQQMYRELERDFGDFIVEQICVPNGMSSGACLILIVEACRLSTQQQEGGSHP